MEGAGRREREGGRDCEERLVEINSALRTEERRLGRVIFRL